MRIDAVAVVLSALCLLAGCSGRQAPSPQAGTQDQAGEQQAVATRLEELDRKIAELEGRLARGSGALRNGSTLRIEGAGRETVLERLRRQERELAAANAAAKVQDQTIASLRHDLTTAREQGRLLGERSDYLAHTQDSLVSAQQTLAERNTRLASVEGQLAASELQRLQAEREYYQLAAAILRVTPDKIVDLPEIQERIRERARMLNAPAKDH